MIFESLGLRGAEGRLSRKGMGGMHTGASSNTDIEIGPKEESAKALKGGQRAACENVAGHRNFLVRVGLCCLPLSAQWP